MVMHLTAVSVQLSVMLLNLDVSLSHCGYIVIRLAVSVAWSGYAVQDRWICGAMQF